MPVIAAPAEPTHSMHGTDFTALATPSRGSQESAVWRVQIPPGAPPTPHSLTREEVFVVLAGTADVTLGTTTATARVGDAIVVAARPALRAAQRGRRAPGAAVLYARGRPGPSG